MEQAVVGTPLHWGLFFVLLVGMLALDLGVFNRREHRIGLREALFWSVVWTVVGLLFNLWIAHRFGRQFGLEFLAGYVIERSLSFDNIFVFVVLFNYFAVPAEHQHRVLFWGILGALVSRGLFIAMGTALLARFEWLILVFGAFLVYTGFKIFRQDETEVHPERNPVVNAFRRFVPDHRPVPGQALLRARGRPPQGDPPDAGAGGRRGHRRHLRRRLDPGGLRRHPQPLHRLHLEHLRHPRPARALLPARRADAQVPLPQATGSAWCWCSSAPRWSPTTGSRSRPGSRSASCWRSWRWPSAPRCCIRCRRPRMRRSCTIRGENTEADFASCPAAREMEIEDVIEEERKR